jgi:hypothetical protein
MGASRLAFFCRLAVVGAARCVQVRLQRCIPNRTTQRLWRLDARTYAKLKGNDRPGCRVGAIASLGRLLGIEILPEVIGEEGLGSL